MARVHELMDRAIRGVRDHFGQSVVYQPVDGAPVPLSGHYVREKATESPGGTLSVSTTRDVLDMRTADLANAGIRPRQNDLVTLEDGQTWRVVEVQPGDVGTTYLVLGRRSA